jgi:ssDNA-binding Zn-finger/Zn-ribbon topoisomerase 1
MSILTNAVDSIAVGLEDYCSKDRRRMISCTRNIFAGILLLFKYKLSSLSPMDSDEALIKQRVLPVQTDDGRLAWKGKGGKTVDVQGITERFESLKINVDWKKIKKINDFRNNIEHYYSNLKHDAVRSLISDSFVIINDFVRVHLRKDPKDLLGDQAWAVLIGVGEVYIKEKAECATALQKLCFFDDEVLTAFKAYSCDECGSGLIMPSVFEGGAFEAEYTCRACDKTLSYEEMTAKAVSEYYSYEVYLSCTDGTESPIVDCPECDGIYLYSQGVCASCGHTAEHKCQRCGSTIIPEELFAEPFCGYCAHMISKDD